MDSSTGDTSPIRQGKTSPRLCWVEVEESLPEPMQRELTPVISLTTSDVHLGNDCLDDNLIVEDVIQDDIVLVDMEREVLGDIDPVPIKDGLGGQDLRSSEATQALQEEPACRTQTPPPTQNSSGKKRFWQRQKVETEAQEHPAPQKKSFGCFPFRLMLRRLFKRN